jgi:hypothetical protein
VLAFAVSAAVVGFGQRAEGDTLQPLTAAEFQARDGRILRGPEAATEIAKVPAIAQPNLPLFTMDSLPNTLFSVNKGRGCTYNEAKTIEAVRKRLAAAAPGVRVAGVMIDYCNPAANGQLSVGASYVANVEPVALKFPAGCVDASGKPASESRCIPPLMPSRMQHLSATVSLSEVTP